MKNTIVLRSEKLRFFILPKFVGKKFSGNKGGNKIMYKKTVGKPTEPTYAKEENI